MNRWILFVKEFAKKNNISYACAISTPECKEEYRAKYGSRKKLPMKKEREMMGAEDINRDEIVIYPKPKSKSKKPKVVESMEMEDINRLLPKGRIEKSKILEQIGKMKSKREREMMGKEDVNRASKVYKISGKDKEGLTRFFEEHFEESDSDSDSSSIASDNPVSIEVEDAKTGKSAEYFENDFRKLMTMKRIKEDDKLFLLAKFLSRKKLLKLDLVENNKNIEEKIKKAREDFDNFNTNYHEDFFDENGNLIISKKKYDNIMNNEIERISKKYGLTESSWI